MGGPRDIQEGSLPDRVGLNEEVGAFRDRTLAGDSFPTVFVDATYRQPPVASTVVCLSWQAGDMCGRFVNFLRERETTEAFAIAEVTEEARRLPPSWNVAPMQVAPVVTLTPDGETRRLIVARWGLVPSWAREASIGSKMFNARAETASEKPAFRSAFRKRRCLVPANGYYEWQVGLDGKRPHFIHPSDGTPAAFAGLWETWGEDEDRLDTFTILTTQARGDLAQIHDRQPVMLAPDSRDAWMDSEASTDEVQAVLTSTPPEVTASPVSKEVGNVHNNHSGLVRPLKEYAAGKPLPSPWPRRGQGGRARR